MMEPMDYVWKFLKGPNNPDIYDMATQALIAEKDKMEPRYLVTHFGISSPQHLPLSADEMIRYKEMQDEVTRRTMGPAPQPVATEDYSTGPTLD